MPETEKYVTPDQMRDVVERIVYALDGTPKPVVDRMRAQARVNCAAGPVPARQWVHDGTALRPARQIGA